jgi:ATP-dependent 26S proteasome regulatory subunit
VVISEEVEQELRALINLLNHKGIPSLDVEPPTGVLLIGPPGTGKTMLARLIATQTRRSLYPITPADVLGGAVGSSVKRLQEVRTPDLHSVSRWTAWKLSRPQIALAG